LRQPIDPQFPQISCALDMSLVREALQRVLFFSSGNHKDMLVIKSCRIEEQRYKPGKNCVIVYHLQVFNVETGSRQDKIVCARLCKKGRGLSELKRAKRKNLYVIDGMRPVVYLPDLEMVVWSFPNDRKLTGLPKMLDLPSLYDLLPQRLIPLVLKQTNRLRKLKTEIVHYLPERSCMIRYKLEVENQPSGAMSSVTIYGKVFPDDSGEETYRTMCQLSKQMTPLKIAKPLGYDPELRALWQSEVPGSPIVAEMIKDPSYFKTMEEIAVSVATFHRTTVESHRHFKLANITSLLQETVDIVLECCPQLTDRLRFLVSALLAQSEEIGRSPSRTTPIHRDLKLGNFLIHEGEVGLIDMDCVCLGDPLSDMGSFIANFYLNGLYVECSESRMRAFVDLFCRTYSEQVEWRVSQKSLRWYISASFVYEVLRRSIRQWNVRRLKYLDQYLDLSERYCFHREGDIF